MLIEVIATTIQDVIDANEYGADRVELCSSMDQDGLTPSIGLIKEASHISKIPINVMVRNHNQSFVYNDADKKIMLDEISFINDTEANGIVIGMLEENGTIDEPFLQAVSEKLNNKEIVFHKAFDQIEDKISTLKIIKEYPDVKTVLTAGGQGSAQDHFKELMILNGHAESFGITIMPGGGLAHDNTDGFRKKFKALHFGTGARTNGSFHHSLSHSRIQMIKGN